MCAVAKANCPRLCEKSNEKHPWLTPVIPHTFLCFNVYVYLYNRTYEFLPVDPAPNNPGLCLLKPAVYIYSASSILPLQSIYSIFRHVVKFQI